MDLGIHDKKGKPVSRRLLHRTTLVGELTVA